MTKLSMGTLPTDNITARSIRLFSVTRVVLDFVTFRCFVENHYSDLARVSVKAKSTNRRVQKRKERVGRRLANKYKTIDAITPSKNSRITRFASNS